MFEDNLLKSSMALPVTKLPSHSNLAVSPDEKCPRSRSGANGENRRREQAHRIKKHSAAKGKGSAMDSKLVMGLLQRMKSKGFSGFVYVMLVMTAFAQIRQSTNHIQKLEAINAETHNRKVHIIAANTRSRSANTEQIITKPAPKNTAIIVKKRIKTEQFILPHALTLGDGGWNNVQIIDLSQWVVTEEPPKNIKHTVPHRTIATYTESSDTDGCIDASPMYDWQDSFHPSCNNIHEIDMDVSRRREGHDTLSRVVNSGFSRDVWSVEMSDSSRWALKSLRYEKDFNTYMFDQQRIDAVVSERLTSSEYVANIYQYCAFTALNDFSSEGTLEEHYKEIPKQERIYVAERLARGLADVHAVGGGDYSPIIHADMDTRQYLLIHGEYVLNDFNTARLLRWDKVNKRSCPGTMSNMNDCNRAPDENIIEGWNDVYEGVDVYSLGNIFYKLLMNHEKYKTIHNSECVRRFLKGEIPSVSDEVDQSTDPVDVALLYVMRKSLIFDPDKRASALEIANYLSETLEQSKDNQNESPLVQSKDDTNKRSFAQSEDEPNESPLVQLKDEPDESPLIQSEDESSKASLAQSEDEPNESPLVHSKHEQNESPLVHSKDEPDESALIQSEDESSKASFAQSEDEPNESPLVHSKDEPDESPLIQSEDESSKASLAQSEDEPNESPLVHSKDEPDESPLIQSEDEPSKASLAQSEDEQNKSRSS